MDHVPIDILSIILNVDNITTGRDYKECALVCRTWHSIISSPERAHMYMNVLSTLIMRHPELKWLVYVGARVTMEIIDECLIPYNHYFISSNPRLTPAFIRKHIAKLDMTALSSNRAFTLDLIEEYIDAVDWAEVSYNPNVTIAFMEKHITRFSGYLYGSV